MSIPSGSLFLLHRIDLFLQAETLIIILSLFICTWISSKLFLRNISQERQQSLNALFKNVLIHTIIGVSLFSLYTGLFSLYARFPSLERILAYIGFIAILEGTLVFIKILRILLFQYLFLSYRNVAFPLLLVNLFTLLLSLTLISWLGTELFDLKIMPLLATSAIFSLVLGLALQDTLGNVFAGISLQIDKPYQLGDWIEIQQTGQKWVGQVYDITWRATLLLAFSEEIITVPNRAMAQAQILNFSSKFRPIIRSHLFRFPFDVDIALIKTLLPLAVKPITALKRHPSPYVNISEITDQWVFVKLIYYIDNFGDQFKIADQVIERCLETLLENQIPLATPTLSVQLTKKT